MPLRLRLALCMIFKSWPFEFRSTCNNCLKIFLVAIADQLDSLWHTVLDDMYTLSFSEVPFGCQQQRQSEAPNRTWACEAHFGPLSQAFIPMLLGGAFSQHIRKITGECLKQYLWGIPKAMCWYYENWSVQVILSGYLGLWGPRWPFES